MRRSIVLYKTRKSRFAGKSLDGINLGARGMMSLLNGDEIKTQSFIIPPLRLQLAEESHAALDMTEREARIGGSCGAKFFNFDHGVIGGGGME